MAKRSSRSSNGGISDEKPVVVNGTPKKNNMINGPAKQVQMEVDHTPKANGTPASKEPSSESTEKQKKNKDNKLTIREKAQKLAGEDSEVKKDLAAGGSMAVLLTQGLMANDAEKIDSVLRDTRLDVVRKTLVDLQVMHVVPLLQAIEHRLRTRGAVEIRPWIRWIQCTFSEHMSYLVSQRNLDNDLGGMLEWMRARVGHQQKLFALHGKLSIIAEQIERRTNCNSEVKTQPLIVFNNDDLEDSDLDDLETVGSEDSGASSEEDWWDEGELRGADDDDDSEEDDSDDGGNRRHERNDDDEDEDDDAMDNNDDDDEDDDDDGEDEDMEV